MMIIIDRETLAVKMIEIQDGNEEITLKNESQFFLSIYNFLYSFILKFLYYSRK